MLEVSAWSQSGSNYVSQFFRDRNGLGFMRGATNGSWTAWKIWANANQFVVGEVRMWSGTATQAAVTAAWGPGWHLCDGTLGTPDLRDQFIVGAGRLYANGAFGGSATSSLALGNIPAHNHVVNVNDPGHGHALTQSPHNHGVNDPGHAHSVFDPSHTHSTVVAYVSNVPGGDIAAGGSTVNTAVNTGVSASFTGIAIYGNGTGISLNSATVGMSVNGALTGITATSSNTGSGTPFTTLPPYYALCYVMYTGA
jgi:hypothetical protein